MLWAEFAQKFVATQRLNGPERGPTDVLHLVVRHAQPLSDRAVSGVLMCAWHGLRAPESEKQHRLTQLCLMPLR